jgi:hypothetical protein
MMGRKIQGSKCLVVSSPAGSGESMTSRMQKDGPCMKLGRKISDIGLIVSTLKGIRDRKYSVLPQVSGFQMMLWNISPQPHLLRRNKTMAFAGLRGVGH